jgi:hypothetical protein
MHVTVRELLAVEQRADLAQLGDDQRVRLPDGQPAEERQAFGIAAIALHRIQDVVVLHPVAAAGPEVVDAIRRRRMHDAGALLQRHVLTQVHRRARS